MCITIPKSVRESLVIEADKESRNLSNMIAVLLTEALTARNNKPQQEN